MLKIVPLQYFKRLFHLPRNTPWYLLRLELDLTGVVPILVKMSLNWIIKILKTAPDRLLRICYLRLLELTDAQSNAEICNWISLLNTLANDKISEDIWRSPSWPYWESKKYLILNALAANLYASRYQS